MVSEPKCEVFEGKPCRKCCGTQRYARSKECRCCKRRRDNSRVSNRTYGMYATKGAAIRAAGALRDSMEFKRLESGYSLESLLD